MNPFVRPATESDIGQLVDAERRFRASVAAVERGGAEYLAELDEAGESGWSARLTDPTWCVAVAGIDGAVLGVGAAQITRPRNSSRVQLLWVDEGAREVGLGESLLDQLVQRCRSAGATRIEAVALPGDRDTKNLFERAGLVARLIVVGRRL